MDGHLIQRWSNLRSFDSVDETRLEMDKEFAFKANSDEDLAEHDVIYITAWSADIACHDYSWHAQLLRHQSGEPDWEAFKHGETVIDLSCCYSEGLKTFRDALFAEGISFEGDAPCTTGDFVIMDWNHDRTQLVAQLGKNSSAPRFSWKDKAYYTL